MPFGIESLPADFANLLRSLPLVADLLAKIEDSTRGLPAMRAGMGRWRRTPGSWPGLMDRQLGSIDTLDGNISSLRESRAPIGRVADRIPGNRRTAD